MCMGILIFNDNEWIELLILFKGWCILKKKILVFFLMLRKGVVIIVIGIFYYYYLLYILFLVNFFMIWYMGIWWVINICKVYWMSKMLL